MYLLNKGCKSPFYIKKYLKNNLCSIYETRPLICRVDEMYETYYKEVMALEEFYALNYKACDVLKSKP